MTPSVDVAIQHHPSRAHLIPTLVERLGGAAVVTDPAPEAVRSPYRTYVAALGAIPGGATHRLIVQDDAWPCDGFREKMLARVEEKPEDLIAFFAPGAAPHRAAVMRAIKAGDRWARLSAAWIPTVALLWPVGRAEQFLAWAAAHYGDGVRRAGDDGPVGMWAQRARVFAYATVPSLVEHPDVVESLIGRKAGAGRNRARVAAAFIDA